MFGLKAFFAALARLTAAITQSAELFETANTHLAEQLGYDRGEKTPAIEHEPTANSRRRK